MRGWSDKYILAVTLLVLLVLPSVDASIRLKNNVIDWYGDEKTGDGGSYAVYSSNTGTYDFSNFFITTPMVGSLNPDPIGGVAFGVLENANIQIRKEVVVEPGDKNYYQIKYKIKNIDKNWKANTSIFPEDIIGDYSVMPAFADLDDDGDLDMVLDGHIGMVFRLFLYKNIGSVNSPRFEYDSYINVPTHDKSGPVFADIDADGDYDLFFCHGEEVLYENTGNSTDPKWTYRYIIPDVWACSFADIDDDGDLDKISIIGDVLNETLALYENIGDNSTPSWQLDAGFFDGINSKIGQEINQTLGFNPVYLTSGDIDSDGDYDLVVGNDYREVVFFENTGNASNPQFGEEDLDQMYFSIKDYGISSAFPVLADLDGDNDPDLIVPSPQGEERLHPVLHYFENRVGEGGAKLEDVRFFEMNFMSCWNQTLTYYDFNQAEDYLIYMEYKNYDVMYSDTLTDGYAVGYWSDDYEDTITDILYSKDVNLNNVVNNTCNQIGLRAALQFNLGDIDVGEEKELVITVVENVTEFTRQPLSDLVVSSLSLSKTSPTGISGVISNIGGNSANYIDLLLVDTYEGDIIKTKTIQLDNTGGMSNTSIAPGESASFSTTWDLDVGHTLKVIIDPSNKIREVDETNNVGEAVLYKSNVYIDADVQPSNLNGIFEDYVAFKLEHYNVVSSESEADYVIHIGDNPYNTMQFPYVFGKRNGHVVMGIHEGTDYYNGFAKYQLFSSKKRVFVEGVELDGVIAATREINFNALEKTNIFLGHAHKDTIAIFDFLRLPLNVPYIYTNGAEFEEIVRKALYGKFKEEEKVVRTLQNTNLRLKHLIPQQSSLFLEYSNVSDLPVMMSGGLWSDIDAWNELGGELADDGRDVWLAEITGGPWSDCDDTCPDYNYTDLVDHHFPTLAAGILHFTGETQLQFVGHSNAGRVALDSLSSWSSGKDPAGYYNSSDPGSDIPLPADPVETFVGVGVPGAFAADSPFGICMKTHGEDMLDKIHFTQTHISQKELGSRLLTELPLNPYCVAIAYFLQKEHKISIELLKQYYLWINNTDDTQPGTGFTIDNAKIIYGTRDLNPVTSSDIVVPVVDANAIYSNINSPNKYKNETKILHSKMTQSREIYDFTKEVINR